jgi:molybdopterin-guanine dinucleotide biosynthesis protein A
MSEHKARPAVSLQGVLLAGGASRRFGSDKASVRIEGQTALERTSQALTAVCDVTVVSGRLAPADWQGETLLWCEDRELGAGPLAGLVSSWLWPADVLLCACDQPLLTAEALRWLLMQRDNQMARLLVPTIDAREQWSTLWLSATLRDEIASRYASGERRLKAVAEAAKGGLRRVEVPAVLRAAFSNANTPTEMVELLAKQNH